MKERLPTAVLAIAALVLFYVLMVPKPAPVSEQPILPLSTEQGPDGLAAARRWLTGERIPVAVLRYRYDRLAQLPLPAQGNVMIAVLPQRLSLRPAEEQPLEAWIERGNTLLVLAALDDTPRWSFGTGANFLRDLQRITHMRVQVMPQVSATAPAAGDASQALVRRLAALAPTTVAFAARGDHPLLQEVQAGEGVSDLPSDHFSAHSMDSSMPLAIAQLRDGNAMLWLKRQGAGQILLCALASPFSNRELARADNAQLLANIIAWSRAADGGVVFDDAHQGATAYYDPRAFFADPRLRRTLCWLIALWLIYVLGPLRLRAAVSAWTPVDELALLNATARFYSVVVGRTQAARRLCENFFNELRRRLGLPEDGLPVWEWLQTQAGVSEQRRHELRQHYACAQQGRNIQLVRLQNLLSELREKLV